MAAAISPMVSRPSGVQQVIGLALLTNAILLAAVAITPGLVTLTALTVLLDLLVLTAALGLGLADPTGPRATR